MNFDEMKPFVRFARFLKLDEESRYEHCVPLDARLFYVCEGCGEIEVNGTIYRMKTYSCIVFSQGTEYRLVTPDNSITYIAVNFDFLHVKSNKTVPVPPVVVNEFSPEMLINGADKIKEFSEPLYFEKISELENSLIKTELEYSERQLYSSEYSSNLMKNILIDCLRYKYNTSNSHITFDVHKILDYVHDNWYRSISNKTVAEKFGFNPNYISNVVKKYTGLSLHKYILHMRIVKSLSYLETHKYSISEISKFCGFSDIYYFSKYFKKEMGISPSEYRKNL